MILNKFNNNVDIKKAEHKVLRFLLWKIINQNISIMYLGARGLYEKNKHLYGFGIRGKRTI